MQPVAPAPLRLAELIMTLSLATDLGTGQPMEHALRVCLLATELAGACDASELERADIYYIALLRAVGCVADADKVAARFGNEILANAHIALVDNANLPDVLGLLLRHVGEGQPVLKRAEMILSAVAAGPSERNQILTAHCEVAARLAQRLGMTAGVALGVTQVYERWDGKGSPYHLRAEEIARAARIVTLARDAELFYRIGGVEEAARVVRQRAGTFYDPALAELFGKRAASLFAASDTPETWEATLAAEPAPHHILSREARERATRAVADFVDLKSPFTTGHSSGVALLAARAAERLGLTEVDVENVRQAGYLHDLGRVGISSAIWDKPGLLLESEREQVRLHPYYTERVLARPRALAQLSSIAALHHERLDGSGYYRGSPAPLLSLQARVLAAADVYHAMTERRPHRAARTTEDAAERLRDEVRAHRLDQDAVHAVLAAAGHAERPARRVWPADLSDREVEVLRLIARSFSNREMAQRLIIAEKTVGHHIQHIYNKIGVSTRAGATLFALQHDLLDSMDAPN